MTVLSTPSRDPLEATIAPDKKSFYISVAERGTSRFAFLRPLTKPPWNRIKVVFATAMAGRKYRMEVKRVTYARCIVASVTAEKDLNLVPGDR